MSTVYALLVGFMVATIVFFNIVLVICGELKKERAFRDAFVDQAIVTERLRKLARFALDACNAETEALDQARKQGLDPESRDIYALETKERVRVAKFAFWKAVAEAGALNYHVPKKMVEAFESRSPDTARSGIYAKH